MRDCARANGTMRCCPKAASGTPTAPPASTDPSHRGDRSPRSPEATRTPSGSSTRGRFVFGVRAKEIHTIKTRLHRAPEASGHCWPEAGKPAKAQGCAVPGCFGTGGKRMQSHTDWRFRRGANAEHRRTIHSGTGLHARPVRAALPWRMPGVGRRCSTTDEWPSGQASADADYTGSNPVRLKWIAQSGRASDC